MIIHYYAPQIDGDAGTEAPQNVFLLDLTVLTIQQMANMHKTGVYIFYIHAILAYLFTGVALYLLYQNWINFIDLRLWYFASPAYLNSTHNKMLLFTDNPKNRRDPVVFRRYLKSRGLTQDPDQVVMGRDFLDLPALVKQHAEITRKFEVLLVKYLKNPTQLPPRPTHHVRGWLGLCGSEIVDSIDYYKERLVVLEERIYKMRAIKDSNYDADSSCFVTFNNIREAHAAAKSLGNPMGKSALANTLISYPNVRQCPLMDDILWDNVGKQITSKRTHAWIARGLFVALAVSWIFLQGAIVTISQLVVVLSSPNDTSVPTGSGVVFLQSIFAPLLGAILNFLLPVFLRTISKLQGCMTENGVERSSLYKYYGFQVWQFIIFVAANIITTIFKSLTGNGKYTLEIILRMFSTAFVSNSTYFITFIVLGYSSFGIEIIQVGRKFFSLTPRDEVELNGTPKFDFMPIYGFLLMTLFVTLSYSLVAPLIIPFGLLIFLIGFVTFKYQLMYVYETKIESGGSWFGKIFNLIIASMIIFQVVTFGALVVVGAQVSNQVIIILPFLTFGFWLYITYRVKPRSEFVSDELTLEESAYFRDSRFESEVLKDRVFNPCIVKLLPKVWVKKEMKVAASSIYHPQYQDVIDYVDKTETNPMKLLEIRDLEKERDKMREVCPDETERVDVDQTESASFDDTFVVESRHIPRNYRS